MNPVEDREPEVTAKAKDLLEKLRAGGLGPADFALLRAGFYANVLRLAETIKPLGPLQAMQLLERSELGDDRIYRYRALLGDRPFIYRIGFAPDGRISAFGLVPTQ